MHLFFRKSMTTNFPFPKYITLSPLKLVIKANLAGSLLNTGRSSFSNFREEISLQI
jgi:hypothetical protein